MFTIATIAADLGMGTYGYYIASSDSLTLIGNAGTIGTAMYSDPMVEYKYPLNHQGSFTDSFSVQHSGMNLNFLQMGVRNVHYDSYGTLTVNGKTFANVIRLHTTSAETNDYGNKTIETATDMYEWIESATCHTLLRIGTMSFGAGADRQTMEVVSATSYALE